MHAMHTLKGRVALFDGSLPPERLCKGTAIFAFIKEIQTKSLAIMAEKRSAVTFDGVMSDLKARKFAPVYLLAGEEPYYIDKIADYITDNALAEEERDFNQIILYGLDSTPMQIMDAAHAAPMMAQYQVIILREAQNMKGIAQLEKYLKSPIPSTILVICYKEKLNDHKGWIAEAQKNGVLFETKKLYDRELPGFIQDYLGSRGATIDQKSMMMLSDHIGTDLSRLASELDKLLISLPADNRKITPAIVEEQIGISKDFNLNELRDAVSRKDILKVNRIANYFYKNPAAGDLHAVVPVLFSYFQTLMQAYYCPDKNNSAALAQYLGLRADWMVRDYNTGMRNYTAMKTMQIIQMLRLTAAKSNGIDSKAADSELMKELFFFILH